MGFVKDLSEGNVMFAGYEVIRMTDFSTCTRRDRNVRPECITTSFGVLICPTDDVDVDEARRDINDILLHLRERYGNSQMFGSPNHNYFRIIASGTPDMSILVPETNMTNEEDIEIYELLKDRLVKNIYLDFSYDVRGNWEDEKIKTIAQINCSERDLYTVPPRDEEEE